MIKAILIDAMSTIFVFKNGLTKYEVFNKLAIAALGKEAPIDKIKKAHDEKRAKHEPWQGLDHIAKWAVINKEVLLSLFPEIDEKTAEEVGGSMARRVSSEANLYQVNQDTKNFLKKAKKKGIRIIIASNQDTDCLNGLIEHFKISGLPHKVYSSSEVGLEKPDPRFFSIILERESLSAKDCLMIGNNPKNDVKAAQEIGLEAILLDPKNSSFFKDLWKLNFFKEVKT